MLEDGDLVVTSMTKDSEVPQVFARIHPPATVGERAVETAEKRNATVSAGTRGARLLRIDKNEYNKVRDENRDIVVERGTRAFW